MENNRGFGPVMKVQLHKFPLHSACSDGKIINSKSGKAMKENYDNFHARGKIKFSLAHLDDKASTETVFIDEIIAEIFLEKPRTNAVLIHKNGDKRDNRSINLEWFYIFDEFEITNEVEYKIQEEEEDSDDEENVIAYKKRDSQTEIEIEDIEIIEKEKIPPHEPIYQKFTIEEQDYDLRDTIEMNDKKWKIAKYKHFELTNYLISEDMELYSRRYKQIINNDNTYMSVKKNGEKFYRFHIFGIMRRINLRDIVASSFLKIPKDAFLSVHKNWNRKTVNIKYKDRYYGQNNHYTNIKWLINSDFKRFKNKNAFISNHGDLYYNKDGVYKIYKDYINKTGLRKIKSPVNLGSTINLRLITALSFVERKNETYKYIMYKDNDFSNDHYKNLIWVNTLSGIHSDGNLYFNIPSFSGYVLSQTNKPYSFKSGLFKEMILQKDEAGYLIVKMIKNNKRIKIRFNRLVSATRNSDFKNYFVVDHFDRIRDNNLPENLKSISFKDNNTNRPYFKKGREIIQIDKNFNTISVFENSVEAVKLLGDKYSVKSIRKCAKKNDKEDEGTNMYNEYIWKYAEKKSIYISTLGEYFIMLFGNFQGVNLEFEKYMISNYGTIVNVKTGYSKKFLIPNGYPMIALRQNGKSKSEMVHVLLALVFVPGRTEEKCFVNHLNERKNIFDITNLQWVTLSENMKYSSYKTSKPVKKISLESGEILGVYDSRVEGAFSCGKTGNSEIGKVCNGEAKSACGYFWKNVEFDEIVNYPELTINKRKELYG
jgi:hypothetical protein